VFVSMPPFEQYMPSHLVVARHQFWRAVTLSLETPWYLFAYESEREGHKVPQTTLVAWESTLLELLASVPEADRKGVARVEMARGQIQRWAFSWIRRIWVPMSDELEETGVLLFQFEGETQVRDTHLQPVPANDGRVLLFTAPSTP
jgi:hypothetical protein